MATKLTRRALFAAAPAILGAQDKAGAKRPVTGEGAFQYEMIHDWGELPRTIRYGNVHGVCVDSQGYIYVHHTVHSTSEGDDSMLVFDPAGKFVKSWGREFKGGAHGLHINREGSDEFLYLCDTRRNIVVKTTLKGEPVWTLGYPKSRPTTPWMPKASLPSSTAPRTSRGRQRGCLCRRRLRLQLRQPVQREG
jgi:sugar lactone lactonase YvrE